MKKTDYVKNWIMKAAEDERFIWVPGTHRVPGTDRDYRVQVLIEALID